MMHAAPSTCMLAHDCPQCSLRWCSHVDTMGAVENGCRATLQVVQKLCSPSRKKGCPRTHREVLEHADVHLHTVPGVKQMMRASGPTCGTAAAMIGGACGSPKVPHSRHSRCSALQYPAVICSALCR